MADLENNRIETGESKVGDASNNLYRDGALEKPMVDERVMASAGLDSSSMAAVKTQLTQFRNGDIQIGKV